MPVADNDLREEVLRAFSSERLRDELSRRGVVALDNNDFLARLRRLNLQRVPYFGHELRDWSGPTWGNALAGETGELCNVLKKLHRGDFGLDESAQYWEAVRDLLKPEIADVAIYLDLLAVSFGVDLQEAIREKWNASSEKVGFPERL